MDDDDQGIEIARITISRTLHGEHLADRVIATDNDGYELGLAEALGMMRLAEDTLIRARLGPSDD